MWQTPMSPTPSSSLPRFRADVGIANGRIAAIGRLRESAAEEIDAEGQVVSPGFIDLHTHMDAQVFWDPLGSCSCWHGVTSAVMGNCGFTLAPSRADGRELVVRNLERAEDIAAEAMAEGIDWSFETYREYLGALDRLPKGINYAGNVGHSALLRRLQRGGTGRRHDSLDLQLELLNFRRDDRLVAFKLRSSRLLKTIHLCGRHLFRLADFLRCRYVDDDFDWVLRNLDHRAPGFVANEVDNLEFTCGDFRGHRLSPNKFP